MKQQKWKWIAVCICIAVILILTFQSQAGTSSLSFAFRKFLLKLFGLSWNEGKKYWWFESAHLRKIAHTIEYFALGLAIRISVKKKWYWCAGICFAISFVDQMVKYFLPTREFDAVDMIFDAAGYLVAMAVVYGVVALRDYIRKKSSEVNTAGETQKK